MTDYPYAAVPKKLRTFLDDIIRLGVPDQATLNWLKTVGYTSSNDPTILKVLEFIGFVDNTRKPTDKWRKFRDSSKSGMVLATAIMEGYSSLYQIYPNAHQSSDDDLKNFFRARTEAGEQAVRRTVNSFKTMCELADFSEIREGEVVQKDQAAAEPAANQPKQPQIDGQIFPSRLNIDIHIHLSSDANKKQIDQMFASMAKHLYNRVVDDHDDHEVQEVHDNHDNYDNHNDHEVQKVHDNHVDR